MPQASQGLYHSEGEIMNMQELVNHLRELAWLTKSKTIYIQAQAGSEAHRLTLNTILELEPWPPDGEDENGKYSWGKMPSGHWIKFYDEI